MRQRPAPTSEPLNAVDRFEALLMAAYAAVSDVRSQLLAESAGTLSFASINRLMITQGRLVGYIEGLNFGNPELARKLAPKATALLNEPPIALRPSRVSRTVKRAHGHIPGDGRVPRSSTLPPDSFSDP